MLRTMVAPAGQPVRYFVGLDLGQRGDYSALSVVERCERETDEIDRVTYERKREVRYWLRHLQRVGLGTPYPEIVEWVRGVLETPELRGASRLVVDETCVGIPVVDLFRAAKLGCPLTAVTITGGGEASDGEGRATAPKRDLILGLQVMFDRGELKIAKGVAGTKELMSELTSMRVRVSENGHDRYGAEGRRGAHDDLVLSVGLACWRARKRRGAMFV